MPFIISIVSSIFYNIRISDPKSKLFNAFSFFCFLFALNFLVFYSINLRNDQFNFINFFSIDHHKFEKYS